MVHGRQPAPGARDAGPRAGRRPRPRRVPMVATLCTERRLSSGEHVALTGAATARNYAPLPVVVAEARGAWVTDVDGRRSLDCLAGYSALNFGHGHPVLLRAAHEQLERVTLTSRAFYNDRLGPFARDLAALAGMDLVLPMNTGAEAVETGIKVARRWGYRVKGDRKSTRLNSSHANISYAVFCLK